LRDGADHSLGIEWLARPFLADTADLSDLPPWEIYLAEADALERLDIPFFSAYSDSSDLWSDGRVIARDFFTEKGIDAAESRLSQLSEQDLVMQTNLIRASIYARYAPQPSDGAGQPPAVDPEPTPDAPLTRKELIDAALVIAEQIRQSAIHGRDGGITWFSANFDPISERLRLLPMTDNLYDGRIGVALFLAAGEHCTGGAGYRELVLSALLPLRKALQQTASVVNRRIPLGAATGLGGQMYALARISSLIEEEEVAKVALRTMEWFTPSRIESDRSLDVIDGCAGGILGLLALSNLTSAGRNLDLAVRCGDHLLQTRIATPTGHRVWPNQWSALPLTGFAHGAAGIAYSLLRLNRATGEPRFRDAAQEAIAYETTLYSTEERNWPDLRDRPGDSKHFMLAWCHGAPGIGMARLAGLSILDNTAVRADIANAVQTTMEVSLKRADHICCGNLGLVDFLIESGIQLARPDLLLEARRRVTSIVSRAHRTGTYRLHAQAPGVADSPSLFQGVAGIGYELLRMADPQRIPCVLRWE
jgi:type 2 lantibiotic biosynthesis protein LanM